MKVKNAPIKIPDRDAKMRILVEKYGPWCPIALSKSNEREKVTDLHHQHLHNTKTNRKLYPLLLHSLWNLVPVSNRYHVVFGSYCRGGERWGDIECQKRERFLERHKCFSKALNRPSDFGASQNPLNNPKAHLVLKSVERLNQ